MKKFLSMIATLLVVVTVCCTAACDWSKKAAFWWFGIKEENTDTSIEVWCSSISNFAYTYYLVNENGRNVVSEQNPEFTHDAEIIIRFDFTIKASEDAIANDYDLFTIKFSVSDGFSARIINANTSSTNNNDLTATYSIGNDAKDCYVEVDIQFCYMGSNFGVDYRVDQSSSPIPDGDKRFSNLIKSNACQPELICSDPLDFSPNSDGGRTVHSYSDKNSWMNKLTIPSEFNGDPVTALANYAFIECYTLTEITIPASVKRIGEKAFTSCSSLKRVIFEGTKEEWLKIASSTGVESESGNVIVSCSDGDLKFYCF